MDAVEYFKNKARMVKADKQGMCDTAECSTCKLSSENNEQDLYCNNFELVYPEKAVEIVEKWANEHPIKTRQSEFLKMYPNARMRGDVLEIRPCDVDDNIECIDRDERCYECYRKYWLEEVE